MNNLLEAIVVEKTFIDHAKTCGRSHITHDQRSDKRQVIFEDTLRDALKKINPSVKDEYLFNEAIDEMVKDRTSKSLFEGNKEVYSLLKSGFQTEMVDGAGETVPVTIHYVDWNTPANNTYQLKQQLTVAGKVYDKRPDIVAMINGIPWIIIECKNTDKKLETAFTDNITDYKEAIPQLFVYNQFVMLTNGSRTKIGSATSSYEHFYSWEKVAGETEENKKDMLTAIMGVLDPVRLLDLVENFVVFDEHYGAKIVAKNHQYHGVNNVYERFGKRKELDGKLGVYRHTQGSGKSYSMMFVVQKILRKVPGNYTFVIVTDRTELDSQIAKGFVDCGITTNKRARATSISDLKQKLQEDHRVIFTLVHKFDESFQNINQRDDVIVITDEAHRSQYGDLAMYMRLALPNASFLGFTGTPLITDEAEPTKKVFGDYVSVYNFKQSVDDGATVPIYYENYTPKVVNENPDLADELEALQEKFSNADDEEEFDASISAKYAILTRDDVLNEIAQHIVSHYMQRGKGSDGKAMVVCIDKHTTVRMYWKVKHYFDEYKAHHPGATIPDMGVMISLGDKQAEDRKMADTGGDFEEIRSIITKRDGDAPWLEKQFKKNDSGLDMVFVCSMWLTGFDVKSCTTLYLQKPMKGHTLMQTIARTNRVFKGKHHGLIVDYVNVFANLQKALSLYASPELGEPSDVIKHKSSFVEALENDVEAVKSFLASKNVSLDSLFEDDGTVGMNMLDAIESIISSEASYKEFLRLHKHAQTNYHALLPDRTAAPFAQTMKTLAILVNSVKQAIGEEQRMSQSDKDLFKEEMNELLDRSISVDEYKVVENFRIKDLSKIDYSKLKEAFDQNKKNSVIQQLAKGLEDNLESMVAVNASRKTLMEKLHKIMEEYNKGSKAIEEIFDELIKLSKDLTEEQNRAARNDMTEEQQAVFDLLAKEVLDENEKKAVKKIAKELLDIVQEVIRQSVQRREKQQTQSEVKVKIDDYLYDHLPASFDNEKLLNTPQNIFGETKKW